MTGVAGAGQDGAGRPAKRRGVYAARLTGPLTGTIEAALVVLVLVGIFAVAWLVFRIPGPLVVQARDDRGEPVMGVRIKCTGPEDGRVFSGITDVFGEVKWPGLIKGPWRCSGLPPDLFHGDVLEGAAVVGDRAPAVVKLRFERPVHASVEVLRPKGAPRAAMAVRAVCPASESGPAVGWEARTGVLGGPAVLWLPHGRACRAGLVHAELGARGAGLSPHPVLECEELPCTGPLEAGVGGHVEAVLEPTAGQWTLARPAIEPDPEPPAPAPR